MKLSQVLIKQNDFQFKEKIYRQEEELAMGAPASSGFSETYTYLQYMENTNIVDVFLQRNVIGYFRYVDDILIVYNTDKTNIHNVHTSFKNIMPTINFTIE
jgi:hypothetical protein